MVRTGRGLYGLETQSVAPQLKSVVRLFARIIQVRTVEQGQTIGYDASYEVAHNARIATLAMGYADGPPRALTSKGFVYIGDVKVPIVGRVSMDLITVDVSAVNEQDAQPGCWAEVIGDHISADEMAEIAGTSSIEILAHFGSRCHRVYKGE